jgi:hypothetical protein
VQDPVGLIGAPTTLHDVLMGNLSVQAEMK